MKTTEQKLTAYALNELPADEQQAIARELETNPEARAAVEEIRTLSASLNEHYSAEEQMMLTDEQREAIFAAARKKKKKIIPYPRKPWIPLSVAASIGVLFLFISGALIVNHSVRTQQKSFCPPPPISMASRQKMSLKSPQVKVKKGSAIRVNSVGRSSSSVQADAESYCSILACAPTFPEAQLADGNHFAEIAENKFALVANEPLSTFSVDVDTASYATVRRYLNDGILPPKDAVRIEEMVNYFNYSDAPPQDDTPFATHLEQAPCPWNASHQLVRIGLKGRVIEQTLRPALNLVFLLDVSGSMNSPDKLPLVKRAMSTLTQQLDQRDRVSIVVYAGASGLVLPPTSGADEKTILKALNQLESGGGTNGGEGIELAYSTALKNFNPAGVNRVILCTDGDFNIGATEGDELHTLIADKATHGISLSVLGFGGGSFNDATMELLADRGNGNYSTIDGFSEARKVLVDEMSGTLVTIAKDVKIQVEFNPTRVAGYRLIGYENRMLATEDFNDDKKDAGDIGAGHSVTALYEIVPAGQSVNDAPPIDALKYQQVESTDIRGELLTVKLRYKQPDSDISSKLEFPLQNASQKLEAASTDFRFATAVAGFGMLLRDSVFKSDLTYDQIIDWAKSAQGEDEFGYRHEFIELVRNAQALTR